MTALRAILVSLGLQVGVFAFVIPMTLSEQAAKANAVLRIVVVQITDLEFNDPGSNEFQEMAKCRIVTDYTGTHTEEDFVYIPCTYDFDDDPSPLMEGDDCIVFLEAMEVAPLAHPVGYPGVYCIQKGKVLDPESEVEGATISVADFEKRIRELLKAHTKGQEQAD